MNAYRLQLSYVKTVIFFGLYGIVSEGSVTSREM